MSFWNFFYKIFNVSDMMKLIFLVSVTMKGGWNRGWERKHGFLQGYGELMEI